MFAGGEEGTLGAVPALQPRRRLLPHALGVPGTLRRGRGELPPHRRRGPGWLLQGTSEQTPKMQRGRSC